MKNTTSRPDKGKSIITVPDDYTVIDVETTGLDPNECDIIEISALRVRSGSIVSTFTSLVKPREYLYISGARPYNDVYYVDSFIEDLTGITNEMLYNAPSPSDVIPAFRDFIGDDILVGQNVSFDMCFIYDAFVSVLGIPLRNECVDIARFSRRLFPDNDHHRLTDITSYCGIEFDQQHRAEGDSTATYQCFEKMKSLIRERFEKVTDFEALFKRSHQMDYSGLQAQTDNFDVDHPFYHKTVVFTGALKDLVRSEAMQLVLNVGGYVSDTVTKETNYLVVGTSDFIDATQGKKSSKMQKAEKYALKGVDIHVIPESAFINIMQESTTE